MSRWWLLLVCLGLVGCATESAVHTRHDRRYNKDYRQWRNHNHDIVERTQQLIKQHNDMSLPQRQLWEQQRTANALEGIEQELRWRNDWDNDHYRSRGQW